MRSMKLSIMVLTLFLITALRPTGVWGADSSSDLFIVQDQNINYGRGYSERSDGGSLGWGENQLLEGYMNMYEATGNREWLDKITDHGDRVLAHATDHNNDGLLGWPDAKYSYPQIKNGLFTIAGARIGALQLIENPSFEIDTNADGVPDGWTREGSAGNVYRSTATADAFDGSAGVVITSDGVNAYRLTYDWNYEPNTTYLLEGYMNLEDVSTQARIEVYDTTASKVLGYIRAHQMGYERYMFNFKTPPSGQLQIRLGLESYEVSGATARFDKITIRAIDEGMLKNGSFEEIDESDPTLPSEWSRVSYNDSDDVYLTTNPADARSGTRALAVTTDSTTWKIATQEIDYIPSVTYRVNYWGRNSSTVPKGRVEIYNVTDAAVVASNSFAGTDWMSGTLEFTAPSVAGKQLLLRLYQTNNDYPGFTSYFDDITITPYFQELEKNGGFEQTSDGDVTMPEDWLRWGTNDSDDVYIVTDPANVYAGNQALAITTDNTTWKVAEQLFNYMPDTQYTIGIWARNSNTSAAARLQIYNVTDSVVINETTITGTNWKYGSFSFTAPSAPGKTIKIRLYQNNNDYVGFTSYFDELSIIRTPFSDSVLNGTFEKVTTTDITKPADWIRGPATGSADAFTSSGINYAGSGNRGAAIATNGSSDFTLEQPFSFAPGQRYAVQFSARASTPDSDARVEIYNVTDQTSLGFHDVASTIWSDGVFTFTSPIDANKSIVVRLKASDPLASGTMLYFDNVDIQRIQQTDAAGWDRVDTPRSQAYRTNGAEAGSTAEWVMELIDNGAAIPKISQKLLNYAPNQTYGFALTAHVSPGGTATYRIVDDTTDTTLASQTMSNTTRLQSVSTFQTPAAGHELRYEVYFEGANPGDSMFIYRAFSAMTWEQMVHEANVMNPLLRFVNAVYDDPELQASYKIKADTYRNFAADNLAFKWDPVWRQITGTDGADNGTGVYTSDEQFHTSFAPGRTRSHNMYLAFSRMFYLLYDATEDEPAYAAVRSKYLSRANDMNRAFQSTIAAHPLNGTLSTDAYLWDYWNAMGPWDQGHYLGERSATEDISHAGLTLTGPYEAYRHGQIFNMSDMMKFTRTLTDVMWNQSLSEPVLDRSNARRPNNTADKATTYLTHYWSNYSQFDQSVTDISEAICRLERCTNLSASNLAKWVRNKAVNTGFENEDPQDNSMPVFWTRTSNTVTGAVYRDDTDSALGDWSVRIS